MRIQALCIDGPVRLDEGHDFLAPALVRQARHRHLVDIGVQREHRFDVHGRDVFAAADDHVVDPTCDKEVTLGVEVASVAREVPARVQALGVGVGAAVIALEGLVAAQLRDDLAFFHRGGHRVWVVLIELDHAQSGVKAGPSRGTGLEGGLLVDREGVDLGAAVVVDKKLRREGCLQFLQQGVVHGRAGKAELAHAAHGAGCETRVRQEVVIQGRHQVQVVHALCLNQFDGALGLKARHADKAAIDQRNRQQGTHAHRVIERHHA